MDDIGLYKVKDSTKQIEFKPIHKFRRIISHPVYIHQQDEGQLSKAATAAADLDQLTQNLS